MQRLTAPKPVAAGVVAERAQSVGGNWIASDQAPAEDKLRFFNREQKAQLDRLTELIIPADDHSLGAREAKMSLFIDSILSHSELEVQDQRAPASGAVARVSQARFQEPLLDCIAAEPDRIMQAVAGNEGRSTTELEKCFAVLKSSTIDRYYTCGIGIHGELEYKGNRPQAEFVAWTHPEHRAKSQHEMRPHPRSRFIPS